MYKNNMWGLLGLLQCLEKTNDPEVRGKVSAKSDKRTLPTSETLRNTGDYDQVTDKSRPNTLRVSGKL